MQKLQTIEKLLILTVSPALWLMFDMCNAILRLSFGSIGQIGCAQIRQNAALTGTCFW